MKWVAGLVAAVAAAVAGYSVAGCAQSVPVVVQQQTLRCERVIEGTEGSYTFSGCQLNGDQESEQGDADSDADGEAPVELKLPTTSCAPSTRAAPRWAWN